LNTGMSVCCNGPMQNNETAEELNTNRVLIRLYILGAYMQACSEQNYALVAIFKFNN